MKQALNKLLASLACITFVLISNSLYAASGPGSGGSGGSLPTRFIVNATCNQPVNNVVELELRLRSPTELQVGGGVVDTNPVFTWSIEIGHRTVSIVTGGPSSSREVLVTGPATFDPAEAQWIAEPPENTPNTDNTTHQFDIIATRDSIPAVTCTGRLHWSNPLGTSPGPMAQNPNGFPNRAPRFPAADFLVASSSNGPGSGTVFLVADELLNTAVPGMNQFAVKVNGIPTAINGAITVLNGNPDDPFDPQFQGALVFNVSGEIAVGDTVEVKYTRATFPNPAVNIMDPQGLKTGSFTRTTTAVEPF
jgi:hypothetical protein